MAARNLNNTLIDCLSSNSKCNTARPTGLRCLPMRLYSHMSAEERETLSMELAHGQSLPSPQTICLHQWTLPIRWPDNSLSESENNR